MFLTWRTLLDQLDRQPADADREAAALQRAGEALAPEFGPPSRPRSAPHALAAPLALADAAAATALEQQTRRSCATLPQLACPLPWPTAAATANDAAAAAHCGRTRPPRRKPTACARSLELARHRRTPPLPPRSQQLRKRHAAHAQNGQAHAQRPSHLAAAGRRTCWRR
ncbi:MAG: hypothetical protein WKG07_04950 [Hymenobacter sp.]